MCHAVRCRTCGKFTWAGCGSHVASVRAAVPAEQWCEGHAKSSAKSSDKSIPKSSGGGLLGRLRGK